MLVIADDLTGAADTAGAFAASGHRCVVVLHGRHGDTQLKPGHHDLGGITIVDTNSRAMRDIDARHATAEVIDRFEPAELFVKIDSTLRGHIRSTVETALSAMDSPPARVVVCPAFPSHARTVANGRVHVRGTAIAGPSLHELFADLSGDIPMFVSDALTDDDLASIVATATTSPNTLGSTLWVGSAGLARHVGRLTPVLRTATHGRAAPGMWS